MARAPRRAADPVACWRIAAESGCIMCLFGSGTARLQRNGVFGFGGAAADAATDHELASERAGLRRAAADRRLGACAPRALKSRLGWAPRLQGVPRGGPASEHQVGSVGEGGQGRRRQTRGALPQSEAAAQKSVPPPLGGGFLPVDYRGVLSHQLGSPVRTVGSGRAARLQNSERVRAPCLGAAPSRQCCYWPSASAGLRLFAVRF